MLVLVKHRFGSELKNINMLIDSVFFSWTRPENIKGPNDMSCDNKQPKGTYNANITTCQARCSKVQATAAKAGQNYLFSDLLLMLFNSLILFNMWLNSIITRQESYHLLVKSNLYQ